MSTNPLRLETIVEQGLCIGCGLCQSLAGPERVRMATTERGVERPAVTAALDVETLARINEVCPGVRIEEMPRASGHDGFRDDPLWGQAGRIAKGHASDPEVRFIGAAGGGLTALAIHLLESGSVDFILHVRASKERPMRSERWLSFDRAQVLEGAGSRYGPAAPLINFEDVLAHERPFAFIGKPCDVAALRNLARHDPRVDRHLRYQLTLFCGGASELGKSEDVLAQFGVSEEDLTLFRYRGHGNPGPLRIETTDGRVFETTYNELWEDESKWRLQFRCKICPDAIGQQADIAGLDVWPGGSPSGEDAGFCGFVARTPRGVKLLEAAERAGAVTLLHDLDYADLENFQPHQSRKKRALAARLDAMRAFGTATPAVRGFGLEALSDRGDYDRQHAGTTERLVLGRHREPLPKADRE